MGWARVVALAGVLLVAGCGSAVGPGQRIVVDVQAAPDLNFKDGVPQPLQFHVVATKSQPRDLAGQDAARLASMGTVMGDGAAWVWAGQAVSLGPLDIREKDEFGFVGIRAMFHDRVRAAVIALDRDDRDGYSFRDGEHRVTFRVGKDSVTAGKGAAAK